MWDGCAAGRIKARAVSGVWATRDELLQMSPDELRKQLAELDS